MERPVGINGEGGEVKQSMSRDWVGGALIRSKLSWPGRKRDATYVRSVCNNNEVSLHLAAVFEGNKSLVAVDRPGRNTQPDFYFAFTMSWAGCRQCLEAAVEINAMEAPGSSTHDLVNV